MAVSLKRPLEDAVFNTKHILMDIEGTTTSISFVKDTLFPYVRKNLDSYVDSHWNEEEFQSVLVLLKEQAVEDKAASLEGAVEIPSEGADKDVQSAVVKNVLWQMDLDRKTTGLKKLQGHMWRQGYKNGELKGHLFADVAPALREWVKDGRKLYIYSSGSVEAQKLLFGNSSEGDLLELFSDFFDTEIGAKVDAASYKAIVEKLQCKADDVLFLTDMPKEASAARQAGLPVILVERDGNEPIASENLKEFSSVSSFGDLAFEVSIKKNKVSGEAGAIEVSSTAVTGETVMDEGKAIGVSSESLGVEAQAMDVVEATIPPALDADLKPVEVEEAVKPADACDDSTVHTNSTEESATAKVEPNAVVLMEEAVPSSVESKDSAMSTESPSRDKSKTGEEISTDVNVSTVTEETAEKIDLKMVEEKDKTVSPESQTCEDESKTDTSASEVIASAKDEVKEMDVVNDSSDEKESKEPMAEEKKNNAQMMIDETARTDHVDKTEEVKKSEETDDHMSEKNTEASSEASDVKETEAEESNGTENKEDQEKNKTRSTNGTCNGSTNGSADETACVMKELEEGNMNNGHSKGNEDVPDVIVAKAVPPVEDAVLPVEA